MEISNVKFTSVNINQQQIDNNFENQQPKSFEDSNKEANLVKIGQHAMKLLNQYQSEFSDKIRKWMNELMTQVKLLCVWIYLICQKTTNKAENFY